MLTIMNDFLTICEYKKNQFWTEIKLNKGERLLKSKNKKER